jgi:hypothetical protein
MTLNDSELTEYTRQLHKIALHIDRHVRDNLEGALFFDFMQLEELGKKGMHRLNVLKPKPPLPDGYK